MNDNYVIKVKVSAPYACFTRPDLKVERMTYPCMTPSAARGVLDSILWKPEFKWHILRVNMLKPLQFASIKRNELSDKQSHEPIYVDEAKRRAQRNSIVLRDVSYIIEAAIYQDSPDAKNTPEKYRAMFNRRVAKGQCYRRPYLGCREFAAEFYPVEPGDSPISETIPIGSMLLDIFFDKSGKPSPRFFYDVFVKEGVLDCSEQYLEMLKSSHIPQKKEEELSSVLYSFESEEIKELKAEGIL